MPTCLNCSELSDGQCMAYQNAKLEYGRPIPPPPIGACTMAIVRGYTKLIKKGMNVLDIGCGTWPYLRDYCKEVGANYEGIDTQKEYYGVKTIASRIENLSELSYPDDNFDLVIGNQTIEHWAEYGCDTVWGLYQCFRVCKPEGKVLMNAPIHFHGVAPFLPGRFDEIEKLFMTFSETVTIERWGEDPRPFSPFIAHRKYKKLMNSHAFIIDIRAVKDIALPMISGNKRIPMRLKRWLNYDVSYFLYLLRLKLRL
jgi:SAM-dependent methyltransferase